MKVTIHSSRRQFSGYFGTVLRSLKDLDLNLYASDNFLLEKSEPTKEQSKEVASFAFSVNSQSSQLPQIKRDIKELIYQKVKTDLDSQANSRGTGELIDLPRNAFQVLDALSIFPRCFLATNARKNQSSGDCALRVMEALRSLRLQPVNTDITRVPNIKEDVNQLLKACAFIVSLHFPFEENRLSPYGTTADEVVGIYAPSDWVLYEETYALAINRRFYRMRHAHVRKPRYSSGTEREFIFTDADFDVQLKELMKHIQVFQSQEDYAIAVRASDREASNMDASLLKRDLDDEYRKEESI